MNCKPQSRWVWHEHLSAKERAMVRKLEAERHAALQRISEISGELHPIRNRAIHRAKRAAKREHV